MFAVYSENGRRRSMVIVGVKFLVCRGDVLLADHTNSRAYATALRPYVCRL